MAYSGDDYDVIIISKGSDGEEAAKRAAQNGKQALLLQLSPGAIASVMCSASQHDSPHGVRTGVDTQLVRPEETSDWPPSVRFEKISSDSHHSVYILQAPEQDTMETPDSQFSSEPESVQYSSQDDKDQTESVMDAEGQPETTDYSFQRNHRENLSQSASFNQHSQETILRERDLNTRKKILHRSGSQSDSWINQQANPPGESIFRERDKKLRQRLNTDRRPADSFVSYKKEKDTEQTKPFQDSPYTFASEPSSPTKKRDSRSSPSFKNDIDSKNSLDQPIPIDSRQGKNKTSSSHKDSFHPRESRTTAQETDSPHSMVWESGKKNQTNRSTTNETQTLTYEPFQEKESRKKPLSNLGNSPTPKEKPRTNHHDPGNPFSQSKPKPLQGQFPKHHTDERTQSPSRASRSHSQHRNKQKPEPKSGYLNQEAARSILKNSTEPQADSLKKDDISIEDPFGQSFDDFYEPFSGENPQDEQLEKRKLALRGLHNLINNLG